MSINLTQKFLYETDDLTSFQKVLGTMVRICMHGEKPSQYSQLYVTTKKPEIFNDGKTWLQKEQRFSKPSFLHVCSISDYKDSIKEGDQTFESYASLVKGVIEHLRNADVEKFFVECGGGYDPVLNHLDWSIDAGFRLSHKAGWGNFLDVSLCNIYYGILE